MLADFSEEVSQQDSARSKAISSNRSSLSSWRSEDNDLEAQGGFEDENSDSDGKVSTKQIRYRTWVQTVDDFDRSNQSAAAKRALILLDGDAMVAVVGSDSSSSSSLEDDEESGQVGAQVMPPFRKISLKLIEEA